MFEIPKTGRKKFCVLEELQDVLGQNVENRRHWNEMRVDGEQQARTRVLGALYTIEGFLGLISRAMKMKRILKNSTGLCRL